MSTLVSAIRSFAGYAFVIAYVILLGGPGLVFAIATGRYAHLLALGNHCIKLAMVILGLRTIVVGDEHIQRHRAALYTVNHASNVEPPVIVAALSDLAPRLKVVYKAVLRKIPILGRGFDAVGFVPIERENRERATQAIDRAVASVRSGNSLLMFPEGTRSRTGALLPFKKGAFVLAIKAQAPIVPTAIHGAARAMRPGSPLIWPTTIRVHFGAPIETDGVQLSERDALADRVRDEVARLLAEAAAAERAAART
ncbi:MAG: 1-acyl-sn-glycerol-3-phosphate acyltransferase [Acidobacteria bacterium]|nr:1-acyl-sn-glycerol-3-phosphate acyltransferase [Acidobacteriota bacterium]